MLARQRPADGFQPPAVGPKGAGRLAWWGRRLFGQTEPGREMYPRSPVRRAAAARQVPTGPQSLDPEPARRPELLLLLLAGAVLAGLLLYLSFPPVGAAALAPAGVARWCCVPRAVTAARGTARPGDRAGLLRAPGGVDGDGCRGRGAGRAGPAPGRVPRGARGSPAGRAAPARLAAVGRGPVGALEALRSRIPFGGFTWGRLAFSQGDSLLTPLAALGGAPLVSVFVALLGALLAQALLRLVGGRPPRSACSPAAGAALGGAALGRCRRPASGCGSLSCRATSPASGWTSMRSVPRSCATTSRRHGASPPASAPVARRPELVIWPENASDIDPFTDPYAFALIDGAVKDIGVPVLVGAVLQGPGDQ